jgi:nucleoside-diphosphate-sugar epimerase
LPLIGDGAGVWSWIHLDDAAAAAVAALERGAGVYNITDDDPAPVAEWLPYLAQVVGAKPPLRARRGSGGSRPAQSPCGG